MILWNSDTHRQTGSAMLRCGLRSGSSQVRALLAGIAIAAVASFAAAQDKGPSPAGEPLAMVDGQPVYENQLPDSEQAQLQRMMAQVYAVKMRALHEALDEKLIDTAAKKKGVSTDELFKTEVVARIQEPTEDEVKAYYESRPEQKSHPYDEVKASIRDGLRNVAIQKQRYLYTQQLWVDALNDGELTLLLKPPKIEIKADASRMKGDPKAPVTIVEFSDFSCPFCRGEESIIKEVMAKYPGQVKLSYRDLPLQQLHPNAEIAAEASRCAGEQSKFWEYHDLLFARPDKQTREGLIEDARTLNLDEGQFDACLSSGRYKAQIEQDIQMANRAGVESTPGFYINDAFVSGAQPIEVFEQIIEKKLSLMNDKRAAN